MTRNFAVAAWSKPDRNVRAPPRSLALLVAASIAAHAALFAVPRALRVGEPPPRVETAQKAGLAARVEAVAGPVIAAAERRVLVEQARA